MTAAFLLLAVVSLRGVYVSAQSARKATKVHNAVLVTIDSIKETTK